MKSEKGITLISLVIYLIAMVIVITIIASVSGYFYKNINIENETQDINLQYSRFNSYFTEDINKFDNGINKIGYLDENGAETDSNNFKQHYILFDSGNQYTFIKQKEEGGKVVYGAIYYNNVKIASNITNCEFKQDSEDSSKITVTIEGNGGFSRSITYKIK